MWFRNENASDQKPFWRRHARRNQAMKVSLRAAARGGGWPPAGVFLVSAAGLLSALALLWFGCRWIGGLLFSRNPAYAITRLEVDSGADLVTYFLREKKGIREGVNLFAFELNKVRDEFLSQRFSAKYKTIQMARVLPGTLRVSVVERAPLAAIGGSALLLADVEGCVFGGGQMKHGLPVITGYPRASLHPGDRLQSGARDALAVLDTCERTGLSRDIMITAIDVRGEFAGKRDDLRLTLNDGVEVDLWWPRRDRKPAEAQADLNERLTYLRGVLKKAQQEGKRLRRVNLTLESYRNNCPATWQN
jgi:cell division septal protein FtsQ